MKVGETQYKVSIPKVIFEKLMNGTVDLPLDTEISILSKYPKNERGGFRVDYGKTLYLTSNNKEEFNINLQDISCKGLGFTSSKKLNIGDILDISLPLQGNEVDVRIRIVRMFDTDKNEIGYGAKFVDLDYEKDKLITQYVYFLELKHRL